MIVEHILVNKFVLPALPDNLLADQFAYRPTCSTTAALVALEHHTAHYQESLSYIRCLLIDYSKAFDTISHPILFHKLLNLNLKPNIASWICNFLTGCTHSVSFGSILSIWKSITASIGPCRGFKIVEFEFRVRVRVSSNFCTFDKYENRRVV